MKKNAIKYITPYEDINRLCTDLSQDLDDIFGKKLLGAYLTGSLTYGDFDRDSSDIDFLIVLQKSMSAEELEKVKTMHHFFAHAYPEWAKRIEASYITKEMLSSKNPPSKPRPYFNERQVYEALYGYEWLINIHAWHECGKTLIGLEPKLLMGNNVSIEAVKTASRYDFYQEWEPLLRESSTLNDSHFQAYAVLTLCRILHREKNDNVASKKVAALWVNKTYDNRWELLINTAQNWYHGQEMNEAEKILDFIKFISQELSG